MQGLGGSSNQEITTVSSACAYGDYEKLVEFVSADPNCVSIPDENGYPPLHWAALNNRVAEATYLLSHGAPINATDHTGQTALHWGVVRGSLPVIETLLRHNADHEMRDNRGYTVAHVAAQYGQTAVLYHLALKWNVDVDSPDTDGRTPLHWAAYKGYADTVRLLIVLDGRYTLADKEGCTPLHWAAIKGNGEACTVLLQGGSTSVLSYKDVTGSTPAQLAVEKGHRYLGMHLAEYKQKQENTGWFSKNSKLAWITDTQLCPVLWIIALFLMTTYTYKVVLPGAGLAVDIASWFILGAGCSGLFFLYKTTTTDPGYLPMGWDSHSKRDSGTPGNRDKMSPTADRSKHHLLGNQQLKSLDSPALWAGNWHQLCVSCRIVRPLRAKHCSVSNRCIEVFDHYCPWVGNAIGKGNRHYFVVFLWLELFAMTVSAVVAIAQIRRHVVGESWSASGLMWMIAFIVVDLFVGISVAALAIAQASQIARNVTTNELANWHRYKYLQSADNQFHNPFSKGCWNNCVEGFNPQKTPPAPVYLYRQSNP